MVLGKLFFIQVIHGEEYSALADRQYSTPSSHIFERGAIFFKEKSGELASAATLGSGFVIAINPKLITEPEKVYEAINSIAPTPWQDFLDKANKKSDPYEEIAHRLTREQADKINTLPFKGISVYKEKWRFYPSSNVAARIIGFVGYSNENQFAGQSGLERYYEDVLARNNNSLNVNFFAEIFSNLGNTIFDGEKREGDLILTIEPVVEKTLHDELADIMKTWNPDLVGGIIINPVSGAVYAMEVLPTFDPNNLKDVKNSNVLNNPLVESVYEWGSIIKPLVMAAGLDAGAVTAKTTYNDKGFVELNGAKIKNFDEKGRGVVPMQEVLNQSLNTGMVFVMQKLGRERFRNYMIAYGLGEETGIDLPSETSGLIKNLQSTRDVEYATAAFGQGIAMTPVGTVRALSALGNGGLLIDPHLIDTIKYKSGLSRKPEFGVEGKQVISKKTSEEITRMLVEVVDKALLGGTVKIPEYSVAAKTGTAQMVNPDGKSYYDDRYLHSFFGYFPAYDPKFLIFLYTVNPKNGATFASHTLTSPFIRLTKFLLNYYEIPPDR
ncbi:MAG: penicillin-binding protein 2 [Patescibacteria group bacterium]